MKRTAATTLSLILCALTLSACSTANFARRVPSGPQDNTARLALHPQFPAAATAAPDFVKEAFRTITKLETELANK